MRNCRHLRGAKEVLVGVERRACLFWGVPTGTSHLSEREKRLLKVDARTRRWLTFVQKIPVYLLMAVPLAVLFSTRSKGVLLVGILLLGLIYVPLVGVVGFYFTHRLGPLELHLRRGYSAVRTGMWRRRSW